MSAPDRTRRTSEPDRQNQIEQLFKLLALVKEDMRALNRLTSLAWEIRKAAPAAFSRLKKAQTKHAREIARLRFERIAEATSLDMLEHHFNSGWAVLHKARINIDQFMEQSGLPSVRDMLFRIAVARQIECLMSNSPWVAGHNRELIESLCSRGDFDVSRVTMAADYARTQLLTEQPSFEDLMQLITGYEGINICSSKTEDSSPYQRHSDSRRPFIIGQAEASSALVF